MKNKSISISRMVEFLVVGGLVAAILLMASCKHSLDPLYFAGQGEAVNSGPCSNDSVYFENTILPLFISYCAKSGCHDAATHREDLVLNSYTSIMASGEITPYDPTKGKIMHAINKSGGGDKMPPAGEAQLTTEQINLIYEWISQGAHNNACTDCDTLNVTYSGKVKPIIDLKCKGCHSGANPPNGIDFSGYGGLQAVALSGQLMGSLNHLPGYSPMPQNTLPLPECQITAIQIWVQDGAPNN